MHTKIVAIVWFSVPIWSDANLAGVKLRDVDSRVGTKKDVENWSQLHKEVIGSAQEIIKLKGYTSWGIGLSVAALTRAILENSQSSYAVSTLVQVLDFHIFKLRV